ncbi:hypothetical protein CYY_001359 [Polysphondylium violaceum]|uniref:Reticulon domain-containing protein n=1 Tax=Polysphondylium violaceum TaxID=133409 RepID=A0A8J4UWA7_9MYCE|nr:hypothetical protein CYY_001359 [Polysphondylium violaceum]
MSNILHKKQQFKKQLEDSFKEHESAVKYFRSVMLWKRPIDFGVLFIITSAILYYISNINISTVSFVGFFVAFILVSHTLFLNFNFKFITKFVPNQSTAEGYSDVINLIVSLKFEFSESISELNRFRAINPTKFNIQATIVCLVLGVIGIYVSGYTLFAFAVYTLLMAPGVLYNRNQNDFVSNTIKSAQPIIDNVAQLAQSLYSKITDALVSSPQPIPGKPSSSSSTAQNIKNNINNTVNNNTNSNTGSNDSNYVQSTFQTVQNINNQYPAAQQQPSRYANDYYDEYQHQGLKKRN